MQLEAALRAHGVDATVINSGVSGDTRRVVWRGRLGAGRQSRLVILDLGGNDALRAIDPKTTEANLDAIVSPQGREARRADRGLLAPPNLGADYQAAFNAVFPAVAARYDATLYPFLLDGVVTDPALNQEDGIHPNAAGVKVIVERMLPYVLQAIQRLDRKAPGP